MRMYPWHAATEKQVLVYTLASVSNEMQTWADKKCELDSLPRRESKQKTTSFERESQVCAKLQTCAEVPGAYSFLV